METEIDYDEVTGLIKEHIKGLCLTDQELSGLIEIEDITISEMEAMGQKADSKVKLLILLSKIIDDVQSKILRELGHEFELDDINDMVMSIVYEFKQFGGEYIDE